MKRKEEIAIYLMNKLSNDEKYIEDIDYIIINNENYNNKREILNNLLSNDSIYGMTPLTEITKKIKNEIYKKERNHKDRVYTIIYITDGEPNSNRVNEKNTFKQELRSLITNIPCELIFNIISDDEAVVNYYNNLDVELNKNIEEMTPIVDVLDNFKSEEIEVYRKNPWFVYTLDIHKKRLCGGNHITFDMIDEQTMNMYYVNIFLKIILDTNEIPNVNDNEYFKKINDIVKDMKVYDIRTKQFKCPIDVNRLKLKYYYEKTIKIYNKNKTIINYIVCYILVYMFVSIIM